MANSPASIFIVEDEVLIRMMIIDMLHQLGYRVAAEAGHIDEAMSVATQGEFDLALLDINVNGVLITPVAQIVAARDVPILFSSGYAPSVLPAIFADRPLLRKPYQAFALAAAISDCLGAWRPDEGTLSSSVNGD